MIHFSFVQLTISTFLNCKVRLIKIKYFATVRIRKLWNREKQNYTVFGGCKTKKLLCNLKITY